MEETRESGVTFREICRMIWKRVWIVAIVTVTVALFAFLGVKFLYNPANSTYSVSFKLSYPNSDKIKYPDGTPFYYQEIVSRERLSAAKESDESFAGIDIEKLLQKDGISISAEIQEQAAASVYTGRYTISARTGYFSGKEQGTRFLSALARLSVSAVIDVATEMNYRLDDSAFREADFNGKLDLLVGEKEGIIAEYNDWIALYNGSYSVGGKTLVNHRTEVESIFGTALKNALEAELEANGYVPLELMESRRELLMAEKERNEREIETLKGLLTLGVKASSDSDSTAFNFSQKISELVARNVQIDTQLANMTEENVKAFEAKLNEVYATLQAAADKVREVGIALCTQESRVYFDTVQAVETGGISSALAGVAGAVVGFLLSGFVVCAAEMSKRRRVSENAADEPKNEE